MKFKRFKFKKIRRRPSEMEIRNRRYARLVGLLHYKITRDEDLPDLGQTPHRQLEHFYYRYYCGMKLRNLILHVCKLRADCGCLWMFVEKLKGSRNLQNVANTELYLEKIFEVHLVTSAIGIYVINTENVGVKGVSITLCFTE
ncbi:hypothetical protein WN51_02330 [Melipona quadrifasciata]|uniref:Uncharacterized protein n=1 Tax=Melipona quadrifasciata TaxID=166423 RepID=A0A0M8ZV46_9HYME|nr:hypothetical protein WN51_02330 [Melipona quadrifasciata]